jgi:hypothetical protein
MSPGNVDTNAFKIEGNMLTLVDKATRNGPVAWRYENDGFKDLLDGRKGKPSWKLDSQKLASSITFFFLQAIVWSKLRRPFRVTLDF